MIALQAQAEMRTTAAAAMILFDHIEADLQVMTPADLDVLHRAIARDQSAPSSMYSRWAKVRSDIAKDIEEGNDRMLRRKRVIAAMRQIGSEAARLLMGLV